jgi:hypothetical protein
MEFSSFETVSYENDPIYGPTYIIETKEWFEKYDSYTNFYKCKIDKLDYENKGNKEWNEIKQRSAKYIQSWWKTKAK